MRQHGSYLNQTFIVSDSTCQNQFYRTFICLSCDLQASGVCFILKEILAVEKCHHPHEDWFNTDVAATVLFGLPPVSQEAWLPLRNLNRKRHCFPWSPSTGNNCELHAAKEKENADGGEEDEERESDRSRGRARVNRQEGVVSKSVPLLMCVVSLPPGLHTLQILHSSYWISKSPDLPTYSSSSHHCGSYSCSLLCLSDFDSVTPTLMGTKRTLRRC